MGALFKAIFGTREPAACDIPLEDKMPPVEPPKGSVVVPAAPNEPVVLTDPSWLAIARKYVGEREIVGPHHNPLIVRWWKELEQPYRDDETAWCGGFVGGVLLEDGRKPVEGPAGARNWLKMPVEIDRPAYGCVVIFWRGSKSGWAGHVGFVVGVDRHGNLMVLGGNQGNMVSIKPFGLDRVLGYRWPGIMPYPDRFTLPVLNSDGTVSTNEA